ncbi:hypothetical protein P154DRAFT_114364 [Amniculicola lignicola CBS 123094]|uniref:Uncharacterized protein n=1 Tax=Amniculicola lignicola CBS 123094 TaxID=1392246 RepID=A0A6A5WZN8_9PLEO|nr:hypothetical protein P154DRAFT_114364 [Amniculicola lignicola CBS 123094]
MPTLFPGSSLISLTPSLADNVTRAHHPPIPQPSKRQTDHPDTRPKPALKCTPSGAGTRNPEKATNTLQSRMTSMRRHPPVHKPPFSIPRRKHLSRSLELSTGAKKKKTGRARKAANLPSGLKTASFSCQSRKVSQFLHLVAHPMTSPAPY